MGKNGEMPVTSYRLRGCLIEAGTKGLPTTSHYCILLMTFMRLQYVKEPEDSVIDLAVTMTLPQTCEAKSPGI